MQSAVEIGAQVRSGRISAAAVAASAVESLVASQPQLNAFTSWDAQGAIRRAEAIDRLVEQGKDPGPLAGVPVGIKDLIDDAGTVNTAGSQFFSEPSASSAEVVRRLGRAGAVILGRTGLHEFAFGFTSENPWFGPVRNPWDTSTSPGGSSGGSGAAVAAGVVPLALGTDTGGSVRVPAALCGVMGLKVTHGRASTTGVFPLAPSLDTVGPIARTVADLTASYAAIAGDDPLDPWSRPVLVDAARPLSLDGLRFGVVRQWMSHPMTDDVGAGFEVFLAAVRETGATVIDVDREVLAAVDAVYRSIGPEVLTVHGERFASHPEMYGPDVAARLRTADDGTSQDVLDAVRWGSAASAAIARLCATEVDVLVCPTVGAMHKTIGEDDITVDGEQVHHRQVLSPFTAPLNRAGVPALALPIAGTGEPPVSVQLVAPKWQEARLLSVGAALEGAGAVSSPEPPIFFA